MAEASDETPQFARWNLAGIHDIKDIRLQFLLTRQRDDCLAHIVYRNHVDHGFLIGNTSELNTALDQPREKIISVPESRCAISSHKSRPVDSNGQPSIGSDRNYFLRHPLTLAIASVEF